MKIQIKSIIGSLLFEYDCENNSIRKTLVKAISESADLRYADLSYADLRYAETDKKYISISCIGLSKRMTTYCFEDDKIWCGCFIGNLLEFKKQVLETHKQNEQYLKEYLGFINYLKSLK